MGIMLIQAGIGENVEEKVKDSWSCKQVRGGESYSSIRTQQPESKCTLKLSQAYKRK